VLLIAVAPASAAERAAPAYRQASTMPVRLQWNANWGYCGESAFIAAGLSLGQYTSQWTARSAAHSFARSLNQTRQASQLLLSWPPSESDWVTAAREMRLNASGFDPSTETAPYATDYLVWIKHRFLLGDRVIIGVLNNVDLLDEERPGDSAYDHIVPVMGIGSNHPLSASDATYYGDDRLTIGDNGLFTPFAPGGRNFGAGNTKENPRGSSLYTYGFDAIQKNRAQANALPKGGCDGNGCSPYLYSIYDNATDEGNYAVAISGITDTDGATVPVRLTPSVNSEGQQDQLNLRRPPASRPLSLTVAVGSAAAPLDPAATYTLYEYTSFANVPTGGFNAAAKANPGSVARTWTITGRTSFSTKLSGLSTGGTYVFRAVPTTAP
jgi:hypothetical protein